MSDEEEFGEDAGGFGDDFEGNNLCMCLFFCVFFERIAFEST